MKDKVAVVTGAGSGIGLGIAVALARRGARVVIADIDETVAQAAAQQLREQGFDAMAVAVDVSAPTDVAGLMDKVMAKFKRIDVLVNNAGVVHNAAPTEISPEQWHKVISVNLDGVFFCSQAAGRVMMAQGGGRIINIASTGAHVASKGYAAYCASKGGVVALTRALAVDWAQHNILVNSVSPGSIATAMSSRMRERDPEGFDRRVRRVPVQRHAKVEDVANAVVFFAGEESGYVTGRDLLVDGGMLAQHPGYVD